jgi:hypothetical protein
MAKLSVTRALKEIKDSIICSTNLPWAILGRAILINTLCSETHTADSKAQEQEYLLNSHKTVGHKKWRKPTFASIIGLKALKVLNWPYLIINSLRQGLQKSVDKLTFIGSSSLSGAKPTPWYGRLVKGLIAVALVPFEVPAYFLAKIGNKIASLFSRSKAKPAELEMTSKKYETLSSPQNGITTTKKVEKTLSASSTVKLQATDSDVSRPSTPSPASCAEEGVVAVAQANTVRFHTLKAKNNTVRIHLAPKPPTFFAPSDSPRVRKLRYKVLSPVVENTPQACAAA